VSSIEERRGLAERLVDPLNRHYRYPAARALLRLAGGLPLRPDHITYIHTTCGIVGASLVAWGNRWALVAAFFLLEIRMVLDCYDGVLARAKKLSSPRGRTMDELGDAVAYIAIVIGMSVHVYRTRSDLSVGMAVALCLTLIAIGGMSGHAYDFYNRRLGVALKEGRDSIAEEIEQKEQLIKKGGAHWITRFGLWFDRWQVRLYEPTVHGGEPAKTVVARAETPGMRLLVRLIGLLSWDNVLGVMSVAILLDRVFEIQLMALAYGPLMFTTARITIWRVLGGKGAAT
jgi:CDP-alcohol phosphatidyltransferase